MKTCGACGQQFQDQFNFCALDGAALVSAPTAAVFEYRPTIMAEQSLMLRLASQIAFQIERMKLAWPRFRSNPQIFLANQINELVESLRRTFARPHLRSGLLTAFAIVLCVTASVALLERRHARQFAENDTADNILPPTMIDLRTQPNADSAPGVGASEDAKGRVGFANGRGEGSGPTPARAQGGGGGGNQSELAASQGRPPIPSEISAPITTTYARNPALPEAGLNIDPVLYKDLPYPNYGDPRSKSTQVSNGPGEGGGVGNGRGTGIGEGTGPGFGPGNHGNLGGGDKGLGCCGSGESNGNNPNKDADVPLKPSQVTLRAKVLSKPEPQYTEEARKAGATGTVILSVVFDRTGQVTNIRVVQSLCCGLTEKAIAAAKQIRFIPAMRGNQVVPMYMQLEYNFNLY